MNHSCIDDIVQRGRQIATTQGAAWPVPSSTAWPAAPPARLLLSPPLRPPLPPPPPLPPRAGSPASVGERRRASRRVPARIRTRSPYTHWAWNAGGMEEEEGQCIQSHKKARGQASTVIYIYIYMLRLLGNRLSRCAGAYAETSCCRRASRRRWRRPKRQGPGTSVPSREGKGAATHPSRNLKPSRRHCSRCPVRPLPHAQRSSRGAGDRSLSGAGDQAGGCSGLQGGEPRGGTGRYLHVGSYL